MIASALASLVSMASFLMLVGGRHGSASTSVLDGFVVMGLPPLTLIAGFGLWRRWRWAWGYVLALVACVAVWNVTRMLRGPTPQHTYTAPSGVPTTVLATDVNYPGHTVITLVSLGVITVLLTKSVRAEFWRTPRTHVAKTISRLAPPPLAASASGAASTEVAPTQAGGLRHLSDIGSRDKGRMDPAPAANRSRPLALFAAIAALFAITSVMGWLVWGGMTSGETYLPGKLASQRRSVARGTEPASYWMSIGVYALVGTGTLGLGAWLTRESFRVRRQVPVMYR